MTHLVFKRWFALLIIKLQKGNASYSKVKNDNSCFKEGSDHKEHPQEYLQQILPTLD